MTSQDRTSRLKWRITPFFLSLRDQVTGVHPKTRIFHPQFLVNENLRLLVERNLVSYFRISADSSVLDVGCGLKPYSYILPHTRWFGIDIYDGPKVDLVIDSTNKWDIKSNEFDFILCTEVLEHATSPQHVIHEMWRVLKPGGFALVTTPFIYGIHGAPYDFRRYTTNGLKIDCEVFEVIESGLLGGIGSSIAINLNNWISLKLSKRFFYMALLTPLFLIHCVFINTVAKILDQIDDTKSFGTNSWILLRKA